MKKTIAMILCLTLCLALFAGCGGSGGSTNANSGSSAANSGSTSAGAAATTASDGKVYEMTVVNHDSINSMGEKWLETLLNTIAEESGGRLKFNYYAGGSMYGATETLDAVKDGAADICWYTTGTYGGVFPLSEFVNMPGNGINSAQLGSAVINTMIKEVPEVAAEDDNWHILAIHGTSNSPFSTVGKKIEKVDDFRGLNIRAAGTIPTMYINQLGCTAIAMPTSDVYDSLAKNTINGMCNDWHNIDCFKLYEPIDYCMDVQMNECASGVLMNKARWDSLPSDLQELFNKYFASYYASDMAGYWWDSCRYWVGDEMRANNVEIYEPSQEVADYIFSDAVVGPVRASYVEYLNGKGYDGEAMTQTFEAIVARFADQYSHVWDSEFNYADWDMTQVDGYQAKY